MPPSINPAPKIGRIQRIQNLYNEYPRQFWVLISATFIDRLGGALLFPFFSLYITKKFGVGMTQVGILFGVFSITGLLSSLVGGALTDRMGRKGLLLFGLVMSALSALLMGIVDQFILFVLVTVVVGLLADVGFPAQQAMIADLLPEDKRAEGFGILRVVANLAVTFGPMIGGLLAATSYLLLFILDASASLITAIILFFTLRETKRPAQEGETQESMLQTFGGYFKVLRDSAFTWFLVASMLSVLVYMQMNTTLSVYLRDIHGVPEQGFGYILSLNAAMVVLLQFPITRWISKFRPMMIMVIGTLFYAVGFGLYGFVSIYILFLVAMVIITIGEMLVSPVSQSIVARLAPEAMRGRYMAAYGFSWIIPSALGPLLAGLVMDNLDPRWVWYGAGLIGLVAAAAYYALEWRTQRLSYSAIDQRLDILEKLEEGRLSAQEAASQLENVGMGAWAQLSPQPVAVRQRQVRIRVSEMASGQMKSDLRLPIGLVNTILYSQGNLTQDINGIDQDKLRALIEQSHQNGSQAISDTDGADRIEITYED
jgi:MFS family permease